MELLHSLLRPLPPVIPQARENLPLVSTIQTSKHLLTYPKPKHGLHEPPRKHQAILQILPDAACPQSRLAAEHAILFEQIHVARHAEQEE